MEMSAARKETRARIKELNRAVRTASTSLGPTHELVEKGRQDVIRLRNEEERMRWAEVVQWHSDAIEQAIGEVNLQQIRTAIRNAQVQLQ